MEPPVTERLSDGLTESTAAAAAASIPDDATLLTSGFGSVGYPKAIPLALAESDRGLSLEIVTGGGVGDEIDTALVSAGAVERRYPGQARPALREAINAGRVAYQDRHYSSFADDVRYGGWVGSSIAVVEAVAVGTGWLIPTTAMGHTPAFVEHADRLFVELNHAQPLGLQQLHDVYTRATPPDRKPLPLDRPTGRIGSPFVEFDPATLEAVVRTDRPDATYSWRSPTETDEAIASHFVDFLREELPVNPLFEDAITFEFGVGNVGNALTSALRSLDVADRRLAFFGELFQDGILDLCELDAFAGASGTALAFSEDGLETLLDDVDRYAQDLVLRPTAVTNSPELIDRFGVIGVNGALEVDLFGHVNSTHIAGSRVYNGIGGSGDFNRHSPLAVVALPSTVGDGERSRIVPMVPHVDHTEHDIDVVVTEHGAADIRGTVPDERAERLIEQCAAPKHRGWLRDYHDAGRSRGGHVPHDLESAFSRL